MTNRKFLLETLLDLECGWHSFIWIKPNWNAELSFNPHACLTIACFISNSWHQRIFWILKIIISQTNQKHHDNSLKLVIKSNFVTKFSANIKWGPKIVYFYYINKHRKSIHIFWASLFISQRRNFRYIAEIKGLFSIFWLI